MWPLYFRFAEIIIYLISMSVYFLHLILFYSSFVKMNVIKIITDEIADILLFIVDKFLFSAVHMIISFFIQYSL
jgi:hypothetical protein